MTYFDFLKTKVEVAPINGFQVGLPELSEALKPHQRDAVIWALNGERRALFESFGLGKTLQELEYCRLVLKHQGGKSLIVLPLGGVGTVPLRALKLGRRGMMTELNEGYFLDAVGYLHEEEDKRDVPTLFDLLDAV